MNQLKKTREQAAGFERSIQLQILEYQDRYYPGGRSVAAVLWEAKFPADTDASNHRGPLKRKH